MAHITHKSTIKLNSNKPPSAVGSGNTLVYSGGGTGWSAVQPSTLSSGQADLVMEGGGIKLRTNGADVYEFSTNLEEIEKMINWVFENTTGRFVLLGTNRIYFEEEADAVTFKLTFGDNHAI